jgi:hypothetical protein
MFNKDINIPFSFIFTSATIDIDMLIDYYFGKPMRKEIYEDYYMIGYVKGSVNFPVERSYVDNDEVNLEQFYNKVIADSITSKSTIRNMDKIIPARDILIFCHSLQTIEQISNIFSKILKKDNKTCFITQNGTTMDQLQNWRLQHQNTLRFHIIHFASGIASCAHQLLATPVEADFEVNFNEIKIIISTPVIESGKTISTLYTCVDNGLHIKPTVFPLHQLNNYNLSENDKYNKVTNISILPIDKFMMIQRLGRVGREAPGLYKHCYTKNTLEKIGTPIPEFKNISSVKNFILPLCENGKVVDVANKNCFVQYFGVDTSIVTNLNMLCSSLITINGLKYSFRDIESSVTDISWVIVAQYLYNIEGMSLLDALLVSSCNRKYLDDELTDKRVIKNNLKISKADILKIDRIDETLRTNILEAYQMYKFIRYESNELHKGFPYVEKYKLKGRGRKTDSENLQQYNNKPYNTYIRNRILGGMLL